MLLLFFLNIRNKEVSRQVEITGREGKGWGSAVTQAFQRQRKERMHFLTLMNISWIKKKTLTDNNKPSPCLSLAYLCVSSPSHNHFVFNHRNDFSNEQRLHHSCHCLLILVILLQCVLSCQFKIKLYYSKSLEWEWHCTTGKCTRRYCFKQTLSVRTEVANLSSYVLISV